MFCCNRVPACYHLYSQAQVPQHVLIPVQSLPAYAFELDEILAYSLFPGKAGGERENQRSEGSQLESPLPLGFDPYHPYHP